MKLAVGYIRVSLEEENPENQKRVIDDFSQRSEFQITEYFYDIGISGSKPAMERQGFTEMINYCERKGIKTIIIQDLTRLGRDIFDVIKTMKFLLEKQYNVIFVKHPEISFTGEETPIQSAMRKAILAMLSSFAELERAFIQERVKAGMERAKKQGKHVGRPYKLNAKQMELLRKLYLEGEKLTEIAKALKVSKATVWRYIKRLNLSRERSTR